MVRSSKPRGARRTPRQSRSLATRDAIVEAAARVFAEHGLKRATTARVAEVAGVSPGSMYQYFPSKDALVTAIYEREAERSHREFLALVAELGTDDLPRLIRAFVASSVDALERDRALNRVLLDELPRVSGARSMRSADEVATRSLRALLEAAREQVHVRDRDAAALLLVRASGYAVLALVDNPLEGAARQAYIDELADMIAAYLLAPRPWRGGVA